MGKHKQRNVWISWVREKAFKIEEMLKWKVRDSKHVFLVLKNSFQVHGEPQITYYACEKPM